MEVVKANKNHKAAVVKILCGSFQNDPHIKYIVGKKAGAENRYKRIMSYAFEQAQANGFVDITSDGQAVAIWRKYDSKKMTFSLLIESILFSYYFGFGGMKRIVEMEKIVQKDYPKEGSFLYLWLIGTLPNSQGKGYGTALLTPILQRCVTNKTAIYLETSVLNNVDYYSKKGFEVYNKIVIGEDHEIELSLMRK
jgi:ribosomal protein S18 acetylase RimI-like enzyme